MAVKNGERYYAGVFYSGGVEQPMTELPDVRDDGRFGRMNCKHCYTDGAPTVSSYEEFDGPTVQALCANCGAGLTPCEPYEAG